MYIFPAHLLNPDPVKAGVSGRVVSGGTSLDDEEDVIATDGGGRWEITFGEMDLDTPELQRLWRQWRSYLSGGAQSVLVPVLTLDTAPRPVAGNGLATPSDIYADDDAFPTEVRFAAPYIEAKIAADAAIRATTVEIEVTKGARIKGGEVFSVGNRAYEIQRVAARDGMAATCKISPPLREAVSADDPVNFEWPLIECRAALRQDLNPEISLGMYGSQAISFVEHVTYGA